MGKIIKICRKKKKSGTEWNKRSGLGRNEKEGKEGKKGKEKKRRKGKKE